MKKKFLFLSALVAASAAFVGCSSDEDLAQVPEIVEEETPVFQGYPMHVSVDATRGTDYDKNTLPGFTMYSKMVYKEGGETKTDWTTGVAFTNNKGACSTVGSVITDFPDNSTEYTFYAVSDPGNIPVDNESHPLIPTVNGETVSFGYVIPTAYTTYAAGEDVKAENIIDGQKDLLVAKTTATGADGKVNLTFNHVLAQIKAIKVYCDASKLVSEAEAAAWSFRVGGDKITIGGLYAQGTYTFGAVTPWETSGTADATFDIPLDATKMGFDKTTFVPGTKAANAVSLPLTDDGFYLIPQAATGWIYEASSTYEVKDAYVELSIQSYLVDTEMYWAFGTDAGSTGYIETTSDEWGFLKVRVPLKFSTLEGGKGYTLILDISNAVAVGDCTYVGEGDPLLGEGVTIEVG